MWKKRTDLNLRETNENLKKTKNRKRKKRFQETFGRRKRQEEEEVSWVCGL